jgi:hypothetical protein
MWYKIIEILTLNVANRENNMKFSKLLLCIVAIGMTTGLYAQVENNRQQQDGSNFNLDVNERDFVALKEYIAGKRNIELKEKVNNLKISGDMRAEWRHMNEKGLRPITIPGVGIFSQDLFFANGPFKSLRGQGKVDPYTINSAVPLGLPLSRNDFDVEFNIYFKYNYERAYAVAHLQFDNACGVSDNGWLNYDEDPAGFHGSGTSREINLKRCYWGYKIYEEGGTLFDIEVGRHKLYDIFESEIQFGSRMDGIALYGSHTKEGYGEWYMMLAGFVVDERVNHLAYGTEIGYMNIMDQGVDIQYSFINWNKYGRNRFFVRNPNGFRFQTSQLTLTYHLNPEWICGKYGEIFGAVLYNSDPKHTPNLFRGEFNPVTDVARVIELHVPGARKKSRERWGWYVGFLIGKVEKEGDWSLEVQYQYVSAFVCPDEDSNGVGIGNVLEESLTYQQRSNMNFKGWKFEGLYAITDNLSIDTKLEFTRSVKKSIGGPHHYSCFEIETIYAF